MPVFVGTLLIATIAMVVAVPIGLFVGDLPGRIRHRPRARARVKPLLEILAGIPTVVYGFFAVLTVAPGLREAGEALGIDIVARTARSPPAASWAS